MPYGPASFVVRRRAVSGSIGFRPFHERFRNQLLCPLRNLRPGAFAQHVRPSAFARAQIVVADMNPQFHALIDEFSKLTQRAIVLNTSFNLHGHPLVMGARDAMEVLLNSSLEYLTVNDTLIAKRARYEATRTASSSGTRC